MTKLRMVCANCGSEDVHVDATATWDAMAQDWVLAGVFGKPAWCNSEECDGGETSIEEQEIDEAPACTP